MVNIFSCFAAQRHCLVMLLFVGLLPVSVSADMYKYRDSTGHIHLTDKPMNGRGFKLLRHYKVSKPKPPSSPATWAALRARKQQFSPIISKVANETRIRPALIHAVIRAESGYRADVVSKKGAVGLMQLIPTTAARYNVVDLTDPYQNITAGSLYLRDLLNMFNQNLTLALAAYNAGENAVIRYGRKIPPYPETQNYVKKVLKFYQG